MNKKVAIIGAGPSGIIAAINISKYTDVVIFEKMPRMGKKIIASGNGKCNLTNMKPLNNNTYNNELARKSYNKYNPKMFREDLLKLGILTKEDIENRVYPITNSSNSVMDNFLYHLENNNVLIYTNTIVLEIKKNDDKYNIITLDTIYKDFDYVIVATGGKSNKQLGSDGEGYKLLEKLNVEHTRLCPGLVGIKTQKDDIKGLDGVRQKAAVTLIDNNNIIFNELGEVQFKKDGISGIVVMNASSIIARKKVFPKLYLDLVPSISEDELITYLKNIKVLNSKMDILRLLKAVLPKMLAQNIYNKLGEKDIESYVSYIKHFELKIIDTYGFDTSQVTVGGIKINEINDDFELKKYRNIYVIGEVLDVDGLCGGYNLHFAFASGTLASNSILKKEGVFYE